MDLAEMEQLVDLVKRSNIRELTIKQGDARITLKKSLEQDFIVEVGGELAVYEVDEIVSAEGELSTFISNFSGEDVERDATVSEYAITAPLVGTFHHVKPMVGLGARVRAGQVVAQIESMKLTTEINSPIDGTVTETYVEDGMPVEYGQPLLVVEPAA